MLYPDANNESTVPYQEYAVQQPIPQHSPQVPYPPVQQPVTPYTEERPLLLSQAAASRSVSQQAPLFTGSQPPAQGLRTGAIVGLMVLLAIVFGTGLFAGWQFGRGGTTAVATSPNVGSLQTGVSPQVTIPPLSGNNIESIREAVIAKMRPTVVQVNVDTAQGAALGSGVIVDKRGYIITNYHVVNGAQGIQVVMSDGVHLTGHVAGVDPTDDLAVLKINPPANITVATLGDSSKLLVGQEVLAIGNPLGITQTVTNGIISALNRSVSEGQGGANIPDAIQTDAPINPGNSGGALVDLQGHLIGIPTLTAIDPEFRTPASGVGFAIPSNRVNFIVPQIIKDGQVTHTGRAGLGIEVIDVDPNVAAQYSLAVTQGVFIAKVVDGGAAAHAGLQQGDVIVQIDNQTVTDSASLTGALITKNPGDTVSVKVYRGNQQLTVNATLGELQAQAG